MTTTTQRPLRPATWFFGRTVEFTDHTGNYSAPALVTGTREKIKAGPNGMSDGVPAIQAENELHLTVEVPDGSRKVRHNIRYGTGPGEWREIPSDRELLEVLGNGGPSRSMR